MDREDLLALQALARESSFTRAAASLHLTQSALSKRIKRLEAELGTALFERSPTAVAPTAVGTEVLARTEAVLRAFDELRRAAAGRPQEAGERPVVRLAVFEPYNGRVAEHLAAAVPQVEVALRVAHPPEAAQLLAAGEVDAATTYEMPGAPAVALPQDAHVTTLFTEPQWVVLGRRHALADAASVSVEELVGVGTEWHVSPPGHPVHDWECAFLLGRAPSAAIVHADDSSLRRIGSGAGAALASPQNRPDAVHVLVPLTPPVLWRHSLVWCPAALPDGTADALVRALRGFHAHQAGRHPRYHDWVVAHGRQYPGLVPPPRR